MTQVTVYVTRRGRIMGYTAVGHTLYAESGADPVCAGVSTLTQSTVNALQGVAGVTPRVLRRPGALAARISRSSGMRWHDAQIILRACAFGLEQLERQFPSFVRVRYRLDESGSAGTIRRKEAGYGKLHNGRRHSIIRP
ncbi:MAG: ribosomal-processing cysteine protease Prp [Oscillospiraceae bacterium]|jgi:uncharacterized protein YsxB (DUF464 family)|nr:ribosomal-processing cysteine protease Prp [Oscillospiraceae bacterium]